MSAELERLAGKFGRRLAEAQANDRIPGPSAAVAHNGEIVWAQAIGLADVEAGREATTEDQYRIGSITKVVTAVCIMQLRDEGRLDLDDPLSAHITESAHRGPTIRRMLSHLSGLQREPVGDVWVTMVMPTMDDVVASIGDAELVLKPGEEWHYSNLAFALLGEVVQRLRGASYPDVIRERVLEPLGMSRTTWTPTAPKAVGYMVAPYDDTVTIEAEIESEGFGPAGQLWSTPSDLVRLGSFLAKPSGDVLAAKTVDEMHAVQAMYDAQWTLGWGLGVELHRGAGGFAAGHGGAMPGFLAQLLYDRSRGLAVAVTSNSGSRNDPDGVAAGMLDDARRELPAEVERWTPGDPVPPELAGVPGRWWSEGEEFVCSYRKGHLEARHSASPPDRPPAVFAPDGEDRYRVESGRERGELLLVVRDDEGRVSQLRWAGYPFTRTPETFG